MELLLNIPRGLAERTANPAQVFEIQLVTLTREHAPHQPRSGDRRASRPIRQASRCPAASRLPMPCAVRGLAIPRAQNWRI